MRASTSWTKPSAPSCGPEAPSSAEPEYGRAVTISYDEALRERIGHSCKARPPRRRRPDETPRRCRGGDRRSEVGEDRVDPAPVDDWIDGRPMADDLDGRMVDVSGGAAFLLCRRASRLRAHSAQWALPGGRIDPGETAVAARAAGVGRGTRHRAVERPCWACSTTTRPGPDTSSRRS